MIRLRSKKQYFKPVDVISENTVRLSFDYEPIFIDGVETDYAVWTEAEYHGDLTLSSIKKFIMDEMDKCIDQLILTGFYWKDKMVWLSIENQLNYKAAFDISVHQKGTYTPFTIKMGDGEYTEYYTFDTAEQLSAFYVAYNKYITDVVSSGWERKGTIDWELYKINEVEQSNIE